MTEKEAKRKQVKCVVWDLDNTLWDGILLENDTVTLRPGVADTIMELDERGILNSIASRNERDLALSKLAEIDLAEYFLYPQVNFNTKSSSIRTIAEGLNIGFDTIAFIDDEPFELDEVVFELPDVLCIDAKEIDTLLARDEFTPPFITADSRRRRKMYQAEHIRAVEESGFTGPTEEFLARLNMKFRITRAQERDLWRAKELTIRTNQLNTTGHTYSYTELDKFRISPDHLLLIASLDDRFGPYGNIGLALLETPGQEWTIKLLLMSCRVMSRGVGTVLINHIKKLAKIEQARLFGEFVHTGLNRMMYVSYRFNKFTEIRRDGDTVRLEADLDDIPPYPDYLQVITEDDVS